MKIWKPKLRKNHTNRTTNYCILPSDEKREAAYFKAGTPMEHEPYIGERISAFFTKQKLNAIYGRTVNTRV